MVRNMTVIIIYLNQINQFLIDGTDQRPKRKDYLVRLKLDNQAKVRERRRKRKTKRKRKREEEKEKKKKKKRKSERETEGKKNW